MNQITKDLLEKSLSLMENIEVFRQEIDTANQATFIMRVEEADYELNVWVKMDVREAVVDYYKGRIEDKERVLKLALLELKKQLEQTKLGLTPPVPLPSSPMPSRVASRTSSPSTR